MGENTLSQNLFSGPTWLRGLFMLLFLLIYGVTEIIVAAVVLLQFLFVLVTGERNENLLRFGNSLSVFIYGIMLYWTYNTEERPFPFGRWPGEDHETR
ncbi:MAG: DUF4389 domain-containing protein [bacterium]|nr:MAG: DUF4389 domain-containing protein [bacterium]